MASPPSLPPELEHTIFLLAYQDDVNEAKNLTLVAKRVFDWIIPRAFSVVQICDGGCSPVEFNEAAYRKYGHHTRHLWISFKDFKTYHALFPNVVNLGYWNCDPASIPFVLQLPLTRLYTTFSQNMIPAMVKVTHLDISSDVRHVMTPISSALYLPKLTHLCVGILAEKDAIKLYLDLERCPRLKVMAIWDCDVDDDNDEAVINKAVRPLVEDPRVVMVCGLTRRDWIAGARGGSDMWKLAEDVVEGRKVLEHA